MLCDVMVSSNMRVECNNSITILIQVLVHARWLLQVPPRARNSRPHTRRGTDHRSERRVRLGHNHQVALLIGRVLDHSLILLARVVQRFLRAVQRQVQQRCIEPRRHVEAVGAIIALGCKRCQHRSGHLALLALAQHMTNEAASADHHRIQLGLELWHLLDRHWPRRCFGWCHFDDTLLQSIQRTSTDQRERER
jgi:hypothetical protein